MHNTKFSTSLINKIHYFLQYQEVNSFIKNYDFEIQILDNKTFRSKYSFIRHNVAKLYEMECLSTVPKTWVFEQ